MHRQVCRWADVTDRAVMPVIKARKKEEYIWTRGTVVFSTSTECYFGSTPPCQIERSPIRRDLRKHRTNLRFAILHTQYLFLKKKKNLTDHFFQPSTLIKYRPVARGMDC